jgi:acetyl-CoA acetyltransferase
VARSHKATIVGVGESTYAKWGGIISQSELAMALEAVKRAADDAGIATREIDGFASYSNDANLPAQMQLGLGVPVLRHASMVWGGGGGGLLGAVAHAAAAVEAGYAHCVAVFRAIAQGQQGRLGKGGKPGPTFNATAPFGLLIPAQQAALMMQRHFHDHGTSPETLAEIAMVCRENAQTNPRALMYARPMDRAAYFAGRMISDPLRLFDCCLESDAAAAVLVTTAERARDLPRDAVDILSVGSGGGPEWGMGFLGGHNMPIEQYSHGNARELGAELFARAGVAPADIDVAQLYDAFTPMVVQALGDYGFCDHDEIAGFVASGALRRDGRLPINTAGGSLSEAYVHGANLLVELVRQLRAEAVNQVAGARLGFIAGGPGVAPTSAAILAREHS